MTDTIFDILVIGGGINGCGIARDAAGRGQSVLLAEMGDLAQGTSSGSTKLIHGGLRYLEHYEFRLVREALKERERLWAMAPHIIWPLRFVLPHHRELRPAWLLRLGLFLYDHLGGRKLLPASRTLNLKRDAAGKGLKPRFTKAFEYSDCWVDDARLVVLNARDAADRGASVRTRTEAVNIRVDDGVWQVELKHADTGTVETVQARKLVNAAGPWVEEMLGRGLADRKNSAGVRLVQGSHIVVPRLFHHDRCYMFQNADDRIVFAIPYEQDFTLIGTTDREHVGDPGDVAISDAEIDYLLDLIGGYVENPPTRDDIVWHYAAVRPLYDDGASKAQEATRDYVLVDQNILGAPIVSVFGGKITTYRCLAEDVMARLGLEQPSWTGTAPLPGGDFSATGFDDLVASHQSRHPDVPEATTRRLTRLYGTRAAALLEGWTERGRHFGADLYEAEVRYLMAEEWASTAEDLLWRRTKLGLRLTDGEKSALAQWMSGTARGD